MSQIKDKKAAIMESALELFTTKGFDNTPTAAITKNAGVATGTLFTYFENKLDLINQLYLATKKELFGILMDVEIPDTLNHDFMLIIWKKMIKWGIENPHKIKFVIQYSSSPYISQLTWESIDEDMEMMGSLFDRSIEEGIIKDLPVDYISALMTGNMYATINYMIANGIDEVEFIEMVYPAMWDMMRK